MRKLCCSILAFGLVLGTALPAMAGEATRVATAFEDDNRFDLFFGVGYDYNYKQAAILREWNTGASSDRTSHLVKDLVYQQQRHTVTPSLEIGLWHDLAIYAALPIVIHDTRNFAFDQRADDCVFGDDASYPDVNCVNKNNSTTIRDGILPRAGFDATEPDAPFVPFAGANTETIFQGPVRRGLDQLVTGIKFGVLNQNRFAHLPNWVIGLEGRFAIGRAMTFSRDTEVGDPDGNHRVGRRIHELGAWTALSRRYRFLDPFFTGFWQYGTRASGSLFANLSDQGAQERIQPQSTAGVTFGTEIVPFERKARKQKVSLLFEGSAILHYGGRGYSEMWELLADSPALVGTNDPASADECDVAAARDYATRNPGDSDYLAEGGSVCRKFGGVTDIQDYASFGLNVGLNVHMGPYARLNLGTRLSTDTRHFLTNADRGNDDDGDGAVDEGTSEVNPVRRDVIDAVGRRYMVDDVLNVYGYLNFLLTF